MRKQVGGAAFALCVALSYGQAQRVRGTLTDSTNHEPVAGAVVTLSDSAGGFVSRGVADARGAFSLIYTPAARTLRVLRIGYQPRERTISRADSVVDVRMQPIATLLGSMRASEKRICPGDVNAGAAVDLWEQARAGLLAAVVGREVNPPRVRLRTYHVTFDPIRRRPIADTIEYNDIVDNRSFIAARAPWIFADEGYMREHPGGDREFYAPDDRVLIDRTFAVTHCLHVVDGKEADEARVGIAFEPVKDDLRDTLVDVTGTLWLDRATLGLRRLEYHYTNLESAARDAGGEIDFTMMPTGVPMIERWKIHTPMLAYDVPVGPDGVARVSSRSNRKNVRTLGYREIGGQVAAASWPDGSRWQGDLPHLRGVVHDPSGAPVADAVVWLRDRPDTVRTGANGRFDFPPMAPGAYTIYVSDTTLARQGIGRDVPKYALVFADAAPEMSLTYYPRADIFKSVCPARSYKPGTAVLLATVVDAAGKLVPHAEIQVEFRDPAGTDTTSSQRALRMGEAGFDGRFAVCGIAEERAMIVRAFKGRNAGGVAVERWGDDVAAVTITLRPPEKP